MTQPFRENAQDMGKRPSLAHAFHGPARLTGLLARFASVSAGAELLELADRHAARIALSDQLPENFNGAYRNGAVELNRKVEDAAQLGTLAHELRHLWQECNDLNPTHRREGARIDAWPVRDPFTYLISVRLREADAFAFEADYIRSYTEKTGDTKPAELMSRQFPEAYGAYASSMAETGGDRAASRQAAFRAFFGNPSKRYDAQTLDSLDRILAEQKMLHREQPMRARRLFSGKSPFRLTAATVRKFGACDDGRNYFDGIPDAELLGRNILGAIDPETKDRLDKTTVRYREFFDAIDARKAPQATARVTP